MKIMVDRGYGVNTKLKMAEHNPLQVMTFYGEHIALN